MSGQPFDAVKPDPRLLDLEAEANPKNEKQEKVETLQELPWRLAVERMDAFLGLIFALAAGLAFFLNLLGVHSRGLCDTPAWLGG
jgi:hypothetical protein